MAKHFNIGLTAFFSAVVMAFIPLSFAASPAKQRLHYQQLYHQGHLEKAAQASRDYLVLHPEDVTARYYLANSYMALYSWNQAKQILNQLVTSVPETNEARLALVALGRIEAWERQNYQKWQHKVTNAEAEDDVQQMAKESKKSNSNAATIDN